MAADAPAAFFSYCREDSEFALKLAEDLRAAGANVWIDQLDIEAGVPWDSAVEDALSNCPRMLVILSPVSVKSQNVRDEVSFALSKQKRVIPVLYRDCDVPLRIARLQHIDFRTDHAHGLRLLLKALSVEQPPAASAAATPEPAKEPHPPAPDSGVRRMVAEQVELEIERRLTAERERQEEEGTKAAEQVRRPSVPPEPTPVEEGRTGVEEQGRVEQQRSVAAERAWLAEGLQGQATTRLAPGEERRLASGRSQLKHGLEPAAEARLHLWYRGKFFLIDVKVDVLFDGRPVGKGSIRNGFDFQLDTTTGTHEIELRRLGAASTIMYRVIGKEDKCSIDVPEAGHYEMEVTYSAVTSFFVFGSPVRVSS